ncbi:CapA family protein [Pseudoxanthomonas daejeonensis]|uniref:Poly-gamma-glutamate biosynthesis protein n=1 Tax=Pseudoxanthomonas daejeonensis TaxID=266062 RepID=A0ABQ6Z6E7_9GAMM|nr:CapA family protein [Pseudoxanthomonas daejeonensis]KAF1694115.1 poly-gamma-glutamate biosynthesis protein [Pseudoxanthomonas daejeonensis]
MATGSIRVCLGLKAFIAAGPRRPASHSASPAHAPRIAPFLLAAFAWGLSPLPVPAIAAPASPDREVSIVFVGDVMVAERPGELITAGIDPFRAFAPLLDAHDLRIGNLECVVATGGDALAKPYTFRADPNVLPVLKRHFDGLSLANNHSGDFGKQAFAEQLDLMRSAGLPGFGGGRNATEAHAPLILERDGLRIALLGYVEFKPRSFEADATRPGVAWSGEDEQVIEDIVAARRDHHADIVIPYLHWGWEEEAQPSPRLRAFARRMIDAGADMVVGGHPHVTQGADVYKGKPIIYSLGNFLFNSFETEATTTGWVLSAQVGPEGVRSWRTHVARLDADGVPWPAGSVASPCGQAGATTVNLCKGSP